MKIVKSMGWMTTPFLWNITAVDVFTWFSILGVYFTLSISPIFRFNILFTLAYAGMTFVIIGKTPTGRSLLKNIYGIMFKKPVKMVVSDYATINSIGHGIRNIEDIQITDAYGHKTIDGNVKLVYTVTSSINQWSIGSDFHEQALEVKKLMNVLEGGEGMYVVNMEDSDTGMLKLIDHLEHFENFEGDDLLAMSNKRKRMLEITATSQIGKSVQQFVVLSVKQKNINRCVNALKKSTRLIRASTYPTDVLLCAMALEGGVDYHVEKKKKRKKAKK